MRDTGSSRLRRALGLTPNERRRLMHGFFRRHPGDGRDPELGFGRAMADFQGWLIDSGRVAAGGGSLWWAAVNGLMVLGLDADPVAHPWDGYVKACADGDAETRQRAFWDAHAASLADSLAGAEALLGGETAAEAEFAAVALDTVERAGALGLRSDGPRLGLAAKYVYPGRYPVTPGELEDLHQVIAALQTHAAASV